MAQRVYVETTIISYLTSRPSRDVVVLGHQVSTREWWETRQTDYELCTSQLVIDEASAGDPTLARARVTLAVTLNRLNITNEARLLTMELLKAGALPQKAADDAAHIAIASVHGVPFLLTWNCRHMANAVMRPVIERVCRANGFSAPIICTPIELMEA